MRAQESPRRRETTGAVNLDTAASLFRRRLASLRCAPLEDGRRDPLDTAEGFRVASPASGLDPWELVAEGRRLEGVGWKSWELAARLGHGWRNGGRP